MSTDSVIHSAADLVSAKRVVIKIGSSSLTTVFGGISVDALSSLVHAVQQMRSNGTAVVLVSSGAIAAGLAPLGLASRPHDLATQQAAAAVGQGKLLAHYSRAFGEYGATVAQLLLTVDDLIRRSTYTNALRALEKLLSLGTVPIINENDAVATAEIRFGDNDRLAAVTANLLHADALVLFSDVDALYDGPPSAGGQPVARVRGREDLSGVTLGPRGRAGVGTGGMVTKVEAAQIVNNNGTPAVLDLRRQCIHPAHRRRGRHLLRSPRQTPRGTLSVAGAPGPHQGEPLHRRRSREGGGPRPPLAAAGRDHRGQRRLRRRRRGRSRRTRRAGPGQGSQRIQRG